MITDTAGVSLDLDRTFKIKTGTDPRKTPDRIRTRRPRILDERSVSSVAGSQLILEMQTLEAEKLINPGLKLTD